MNLHVSNKPSVVVPFSLRDAPSLIERMFPSTKISAEARKERKAGSGQTLTALGSYWKGRKPLVLVRACVLGCLLPATDNPEADLNVFELLMSIDDDAFLQRERSLKVNQIAELALRSGKYGIQDIASMVAIRRKHAASIEEIQAAIENGGLVWNCGPDEQVALRRAAHSALSYDARVAVSLRPEELGSGPSDSVWPSVNSHLGTDANNLTQLVQQLGIMRFGRRPVVSDTFAGGGSIPFEAARMGCEAVASDLNPIACLLTWGGVNIVGASAAHRTSIVQKQNDVANRVDAELLRLGIESDENGNRAKAFYYCLETLCPETGWLVPMLPSFVISKAHGIVVRLVPEPTEKRYGLTIATGQSAAAMRDAEKGTMVDGRLVHPENPDTDGVPLSTIRGDYRGENRRLLNKLRPWDRTEFRPRADDVLRERLYCIQWIDAATKEAPRPLTFFRTPDDADLKREAEVERIVADGLAGWQADGLVPDMPIEPGSKTDEPIRTRGWTHWHHLFAPRQLLSLKLFLEYAGDDADLLAFFPDALQRGSKLCRIDTYPGPGRFPKIVETFSDMALNTFFNYGVRAWPYWRDVFEGCKDVHSRGEVSARTVVKSQPAFEIDYVCDVFITDPPYADAVVYHEITEFFIAWLRARPVPEFQNWNWDSRRRIAIKGTGEAFRANMVQAYAAMASHMPDNGIQVVMFTHQDGKVWSDMTQIFWGSGLQVIADWYIATETTGGYREGGFVQGTHCIVLRKRPEALSGYSDEISQEVKDAVAFQIEEMVGLNQTLRGHGRSENVFNDADLQMAGYAAALRVLTSYAKIDGKDMTVEAMRPRTKNERTLVDDIIEYAVQVANEHLVPEGMDGQTWRRLAGMERFYLKMLDIEQTGARKVDNYQNFAKAFRVADHGALMASEKANDAYLKSAKSFGKRQMGDDEFGSSPTRAVLYALWELGEGVPDDDVLDHLHGLVPDYLERRADLQVIARYISTKRRKSEPTEAENAEILAGIIRNERLG